MNDNDVEHALRRDADDWNRAQPSPPDFDDALRAATAPRQLFTLSGRQRLTGAVGAVLVVAATVLVAVVVGANRHGGSGHHVDVGQRPAAPTSIVVNGKTIPYAGGVPWADAIVSDPRSSSVAVYADGDAMVTKKFVCGLPTERAYVHETSTRVTILVAGYERALAANVGCSDVGHAPQAHLVALKAPLGRRTLIDATGLRSHPVLDASTVPQLTVPAGFAADPITWSDGTGRITLGYHTANDTERIYLDFGTLATIAPDDGRGGTVLEKVRIGSATATVRRYKDIYNDLTTVIWIVGRHRLALVAYGSPKVHLSVAEAIGIARSVH